MNLYQVVVSQQSVRTLFKSLAPLFCKCFFFKWPPVIILLPFQINTTILVFVKCFTQWLPAAKLDVRNSLLMAFLAISNRYAT